MANLLSSLITYRHPTYTSNYTDFDLWRLTYDGGEEYLNRYLKQFSSREDWADFEYRKSMTPIPNFAASAINDIRNSIYQRLSDIVRRDGSDPYMRACTGLDLGVDRRGSSMNAFLGMEILTELLIMGRVGVYVDAPVSTGFGTQAETAKNRPYVYPYTAEKILNWSYSRPDELSEFQSVLLKDEVLQYDGFTGLPTTTQQRYRMLWISPETGKVNLQFYSEEGEEIDSQGNPGGFIELELTRIPYVMIDIRGSLLKNVARHQIALLNLGSSDVNFCLKSNFPFYVEQKDLRPGGAHLKAPGTDGTATAGGQGAAENDNKSGSTYGKYYGLNVDAPQFINPSSEPLKASMELQGKLEGDIRKLVNLSVSSLAANATQEARIVDNQSLEAGLSYIGLALERVEWQIAAHWAAYEQKIESKRQIPVIKYPDRYSLKTDMDRLAESEKMSTIITGTPSRTARKELWKVTLSTLLGGKISLETIKKINTEIDNAHFTTSDPKTIIDAKNAGICGDQVAGMALGFDDDEYIQANKDHLARIVRIAESQAKGKGMGASADGGNLDNPAARGVNDLSANPKPAAANEKAASRDTTLNDTTKPTTRGEGK